MSIDVRETMCTGCGCCILICPEGAVDNLPSFIARIDEDLCTECLECIDGCPNQALGVC
jgi:pyruvate ferredoxin oxidoreductase delta subunit